ncbi:hypothetical protein SNEBB_000052 [Seison nebaliae]|nr:hypothetical protein SNEBB_000052 [Seison nebaliae]
MDYMKISKRFSFVIKIINFNSMKQIGKIIEKEFKYLSENGLKISNHFSPYYQIYQLLPLSLYGQKTVEFSIDCSKKNIIMISQFQGIIYSLNASSFYQKLHCSLLANFSNNLHVRSEPIILIFTKTIEEKCQENEIIIEKKNHQSCERSDVHECNMTCAYSGSKTNRCQWKNYSDTSFLNKKIQCSHDHEVCPDEICDEVEWEYWRMNKQVLCDNDCRQFVYRRKDENVTISSSFNVNQKSDDYYFILISIPMLIILITLIYYVLRSVNHPNKMKKFESDKNNGNYRYWISFQKLHVNGSLSSGHFANVISGKLSLEKSHSIDVAIKVGKKFGCNSGISDILNEYNIFEILQNEENGGRENVCRMIGISTDEHDGIYLVMEFAKLGNLTEYLQTIASTVNFGVRFQKMRMNDDLLISTINSSTLSFEDGCYIYSIEFENVVRGICNRNKKLNCLEKFLVFKQLSDYCQQVTNGLKFLHSHKIIHSDIAARNILVFSKDLVKIGDFGMAVNGKNPELKKNREIPLFWSSLNILENETPKYEDDIWSLGVVFWEIFHLCVAQPYSLTEINKKKFTVLLDPNEMNYLFINESMNFKNNFIKYLKNGYRLPPPGMLLQSYRELKSESINSSEQNLSKSSKSTNGDEDLIDTSVSSTHSYENVMELRHKTKNPYQSDDQIRMEENKSKSGYYHPSILNRFCSKNSYCQSISENCSFIKPNKFSRVSCKKNSLLFTSEITERLFNLMLNCWNGQESFSLDEIWMEINKINQGISKVASEELNIFHNGTYNAMKSNCLYESKCKRIH